MVSSMTGYGRGEALKENISVVVELRSVNHRYFEFSSRIPRGYAFLEDKLKSYLSSRVSRGKIEMYVSIESEENSNISISLNKGYLDAYTAALDELARHYKIKNKVTTADFIGNNDAFVVSRKEIDEESATEAVLSVCSDAVDRFIDMRRAEGVKLSDDVKSRSALILEKVAFIESKSPETVAAYRERLESKIRELLGDVKLDDGRILTETAIYADKVAVAEETVRLRSHIEQLNDMLSGDEAIGRKLDFIVQEMNREANTIGSKASDLEIARTVVDIKSEIEKIREQIQNIE